MRGLLTIILALLCSAAYAEGYMLPKSFSVIKFDAPVIEQKSANPVNKTTPTASAVQKNSVPASNIVSSITQEKPQTVIKQQSIPIKQDVSLTNLIKNYNYDYASTFKLTLNTLPQFNIIPLDCDSSKGQIRAKLASTGKELFILLLPSNQNLTNVRITPADGNYNLPTGLVNQIFDAIGKNLQGGV